MTGLHGLRDTNITLPEEKEIKVRIRGDQHAKLYSLKALKKKAMKDAIVEALDLYFETLRRQEAAAE